MRNALITICTFIFIFSTKNIYSVEGDSTRKHTFCLTYQNVLFDAIIQTSSPNHFVFINGFQPGFKYFLTNRIRVGAMYHGIFQHYSIRPDWNFFFNNAEVEITYIIKEIKRTTFHITAGYFYGNFRPHRSPEFQGLKIPGGMPRIGFGAIFRYPGIPNLKSTVDFHFYKPLYKPQSEYHRLIIPLTFGLLYHLPTH